MAYAALVSLTNILEQNLHQNLIPQNCPCIETLLQGASFLQDFLEKSSPKRSESIKCVESRMRDAAYKAESIIESHTVDRLLEESASDGAESFTNLLQDLEKVIKEINSVKLEVMQIKEKDNDNNEHDLQPRISLAAAPSRPASSGMTTMVGLEDDLLEIKTRLVSDSSKLETVSLVGMGGIGKTTLARKVYDDESIVYRFDTRLWVTVSQEYSVQNILLDLLNSTKMMRKESDEELSEYLYKSLKGMRYFIVLDDLWDTEVWDDVKRIFPNDGNGSRILLTTRLENVANHANSRLPLHRVRFLNDEESWSLFCVKVFGQGRCPLELVEIGKEIVQNCRGLPLAVNVIGGLLSQATKTKQYWRSVAENLSPTINSNDEQCLRVLYLSYNHLPHHLKGCFLYMGIYPEDFKIRVSELLRLWVAEGFIKQVGSKSLEDFAKEYFLNLVERNLIMVCSRKFNGKIEECKIHDLLRDLCIREAQSEMFFHIADSSLFRIPEGSSLRRVSFHPKTNIHHHSAERLSTSQIRSFLSFDEVGDNVAPRLDALKFRLLRVWHLERHRGVLVSTMVEQKANLRYIYISPYCCVSTEFLEFMHEFKHLQTLIFSCDPDESFFRVLNIWKMPQLRHVRIYGTVILADPPATNIEGGNPVIILENLETLSNVFNLVCTDELLQRIPNLKKLAIQYSLNKKDWSYYDLHNLVRLNKLESLDLSFLGAPFLLSHDITFPTSLKKLTLHTCLIPWKEMRIVGSLPNLEVLKLESNAFVGKEWEPNEGEFLNLKYLRLESITELVYWRADGIHFPKLQFLDIDWCQFLQDIPCGIGEIPTLQLIRVCRCRKSVESSAKEIQEEQQSLGNDDFQVFFKDNVY